MIVREIIDIIDSFAPFSNAESFDNVGLLVGNENEKVRAILFCLDLTNEVVDEAEELGANLVITHHPVIFTPLKKLTSNMPVYRAIERGISIISAHTNLDKAVPGVNTVLAESLGLRNIAPISVIDAEKLDYGYGCVGELESYVTAEEISNLVKKSLNIAAVRCSDNSDKQINRVAVIGGSGGSLLNMVKKISADCFVTGDVKLDVFYTANDIGVTIIDAGHYHTEIGIVEKLAEIFSPYFNKDEIHISKANTSPYKII